MSRRAAALSFAACLITGCVALRRLGSAGDPGAVSSLGVVSSGFALALFLFHLMRIGPARRFAAGEIWNEWCAAIWIIAAKAASDVVA